MKCSSNFFEGLFDRSRTEVFDTTISVSPFSLIRGNIIIIPIYILSWTLECNKEWLFSLLLIKEMAIFSKKLLSMLVSDFFKWVSVSVSVSNFRSSKYQYQYRYRNFRLVKYQYHIGIDFSDLESISIVSVSKKVVSKTSGNRTCLYDFCNLLYS